MIQHEEIRLPPGPKGRWRPTLRLIRDPRSAMEDWVKQYGDPFLLHALNGPVVVTGREDLIRLIHGQDPDIYEPFAIQTAGPILGLGSMLVLQGDRHRKERRMMTPMFHGDRMKAYGTIMQATAIARVEQHVKQDVVATTDLMTEISLEIIIRTIFGGDDSQLIQKMFDACRKVFACANPLLFFSRRTHITFFGWTPWDRWQNAKGELCDLLDLAIDQRQKSNAERDDILALLCTARYEDGQPLSRADLHAELMTFLFAGHETTALSLAWAIYHLHRAPQILQSLRTELNSLPDDSLHELATAPYLKAVIQETLRINPIVTETLRKLKSPLKFGDYYLPAGMALAPATVLAHYNPVVFPDPDFFRPERFLERSFTPFEYMPFGGGHRRCIGAAFASYEMAMVLGALLKRFDFELVDAEPVIVKRRNVTMGPSTKIPVRIRLR